MSNNLDGVKTTIVASRTEQTTLIAAAMRRSLPFIEERVAQRLAEVSLDVLAGSSCALPSATTIGSWWFDSVETVKYKCLFGSTAVEHMLRTTIAPILAAQAAEVAELRAIDAQYRSARAACVEARIPVEPLLQDMVDALVKQRNEALVRVVELEKETSKPIADKDALETYRELLKPFRRDGELAIQTLRRIVDIANDWRQDGGVWKKRMGNVELTAGRDVTLHRPLFLASVQYAYTSVNVCNIASIEDAKSIAVQVAKEHFAAHIGATQ